MRFGFPRWAASTLTMTSVAALVLLVTGWGSAVAASVRSVIVTNTAKHPAQVHITGTASVKVANSDANGNIKVAEQGTPNVKVQDFPSTQTVNGSVNVGNFPSSQTVNGSVNVGNLPAAPKTSEIASGATFVAAGTSADLLPLTDVSQYREVTLYLFHVNGNHLANDACVVQTEDTESTVFNVDSFTAGGIGTIAVKTYDPAPPNIRVSCNNQDTTDQTLHWMLAGRTG